MSEDFPILMCAWQGIALVTLDWFHCLNFASSFIVVLLGGMLLLWWRSK